MRQSPVVLLALGEDRRKEIGHVLQKQGEALELTGKALELSVLVSGDSGRKKSKGDTDESSGVGRVVDAVELHHMFSSGEASGRILLTASAV